MPFIITTEKKLKSQSILRMLDPGDIWEEDVWTNNVRKDDWASIMDRHPGQPWHHMSELYGKHPGETIIVTGSGPSLLPAIPALQKTKRTVMSINRSIRHVPATYFCAHDIEPITELIDHPNVQAAKKIISCQILHQVREGTELYGIEAAGQPSRWMEGKRPLYWNEITLGWVIHLCIRMGAKRVVTIGCDLSLGYPDGFLQKGRTKEWLEAQHRGCQERTIEMFRKDGEHWRDAECEVLDASGGLMPVPQVKLEDYL
jgi:hypothetical protein